MKARVPDVSDCQCDRTYIVVDGDTCDGISIKQNVSTFQLANANAGIINADCSNLFGGEVLLFPAYAGLDDANLTLFPRFS